MVDLPKMLTGRGYDTDGECVIEMMDDDLCEWNNGRYLLTVSDGVADVQSSSRVADLTRRRGVNLKHGILVGRCA